jgi:hypothetical protein
MTGRPRIEGWLPVAALLSSWSNTSRPHQEEGSAERGARKIIRGVALSIAVPLNGPFAGRTRLTRALEPTQGSQLGHYPAARSGTASTTKMRA